MIGPRLCVRIVTVRIIVYHDAIEWKGLFIYMIAQGLGLVGSVSG